MTQGSVLKVDYMSYLLLSSIAVLLNKISHTNSQLPHFQVMQQVRPHRMILVRGREDQAQSMSTQCQALWRRAAESSGHTYADTPIYTPANGETVDATTESFIYQVKLPESLVSQLLFSKGKDGMLAWVDGRITYAKDEGVMDVAEKDAEDADDAGNANDDGAGDASEKGKDKAVIPTLEPVGEDEIYGHNAVFVNEVKLSTFKTVLTRHGIGSEFLGGVLYCGNGNVALRRHDSGRVTIEGTVCEEYYQVRELLYEQYAIV